jgi:general nucleoside transport system ATP-binding protein
MRIELKEIHKHYGPVKANNGISLCVEPGTIHGILGENGAGKSTLMKILSGLSRKTDGMICLDNRREEYGTPARAARLGIGMLYQDPLDFPSLTVLDNFILGLSTQPDRSRSAWCDHLFELAESVGFSLEPFHLLKTLTVGERQQLEILRLLALGIEVLILDEPTTGISAFQKETLFQALNTMTDEGKSVILVSHKLEDVETLCHRVTVLRKGRVTGEMVQPFDTTALLAMMFGTPPSPPARRPQTPGDILLSLENVSARGGRSGLRDCTFQAREKEIIGLAGLEGSGQSVFLRTAAGLTRPRSGTVRFRRENMTGRDFHRFSEKGLAFLPADRLEEGLVRELTLAEHFAIQDEKQGFFLNRGRATEKARRKIEKFNIIGRADSTAESLSGGNQQRLLLSFLPQNPNLLLLENPTRGLDLESAQWVWRHLQAFCETGTGIVFSSSELDEILMVAHRVLVFFNGRIVKEVKADQTDVNALGRALAGKA